MTSNLTALRDRRQTSHEVTNLSHDTVDAGPAVIVYRLT